MITLFANQAANANSAGVPTQHRSTNTTCTLAAWGGFGSGTLALKFSPDGGTTWLDFPTPITLTAAGTKQVFVPTGVYVRGELTGATAATLNAALFDAD